MRKDLKLNLGILAMIFVSFMSLIACDRQDDLYLIGKHRVSEEVDDNGVGVAFEMDSDSLEDEIEEIYFEASEWDEEEMNADL